MRLSGQFKASLFFLRKNLELTKRQIKPKPTGKTKLSKQKATNATIFCPGKLLRGGKIGYFAFLKKIEIVLITLFTILLAAIKRCSEN